jgi:hypothetical protein
MLPQYSVFSKFLSVKINGSNAQISYCIQMTTAFFCFKKKMGNALPEKLWKVGFTLFCLH